MESPPEALWQLDWPRIVAWFQRDWPFLAISFTLHFGIAFVLALFVLQAPDRELLFDALTLGDPTESVLEPFDQPYVQPETLLDLGVNSSARNVDAELIAQQPNPFELDENDLELSTELEGEGQGGSSGTDRNGGPGGGELSGRSRAGRTANVNAGGGNAASEASVNGGLKWIARNQQRDGSWSFINGPDDPVTLENRMGATGLALMAFLGAGHTHLEGDYRKVMRDGLEYLTKNMRVTPEGGDLRGTVMANEGMYVQGICTIALCEAYALSEDKSLKPAAQLAVDFIVNAQDPKGGGWRYAPREPGDTSVVGWQVMALKSAKMAKLKVSGRAFSRVNTFLKHVQSEGGARYGYAGPGNAPGTTAVGLLCRMYLGWSHQKPALEEGVAFLSDLGPQPNNMYYCYYATQVLHHYGGERWTRWNAVMRDHLVKTQLTEGDQIGSWNHDRSHGNAGGRLYATCLSVMTLEVYYRHLPLYARQSTQTEL